MWSTQVINTSESFVGWIDCVFIFLLDVIIAVDAVGFKNLLGCLDLYVMIHKQKLIVESNHNILREIWKSFCDIRLERCENDSHFQRYAEK